MEDLESEKAILSAVFNYGTDAYLECCDIIKTDNFSDLANQIIWRSLLEIYEKDINTKFDYPTLLSAAQNIGLGDNLKKLSPYLKDIKATHVEKDNIRKLAQKIRKCDIIRTGVSVCEDIVRRASKLKGSESLDTITSVFESGIFDFITSLGDSESSPETIRKMAREYIKFLGENPRDNVGISTGYPVLDRLMGGGNRRGTISVFGAATGVGKTTLSFNTGLHVSGKLNVPTLFLDCELKEEDSIPRLIANMSNVPITEIEEGKFYQNSFKRKRIDDSLDLFEKYPLYYHKVNGADYAEITSYIRRWVMRYVGINKETGKSNDCLIILDYLKVMNENDRDEREYITFGNIMQALVTIAGKLDVPIMTFVQENREGGISQSHRIEWMASNVFLFQRLTPEEIAESPPGSGNRKLVWRKTRYAPEVSNDYICYNFDGKINKLTEIGLKSILLKNPPSQTTSQATGFNEDDDAPDF